MKEEHKKILDFVDKYVDGWTQKVREEQGHTRFFEYPSEDRSAIATLSLLRDKLHKKFGDGVKIKGPLPRRPESGSDE